MKRSLGLICMMVMLGLASTSLALDPILMGDFENGPTEVSSTDIRWDGWMINSNSSAVTVPAMAATRGTHSLKWVDTDGGSWLADNTTYPYGGTLDARLEALLNPGSAIVVDVTAIDSEVVGDYVDMCLFYNASGGWGFDDTTWQSVTIDGTPHTYVFYVTDQVRTVIQDSIGGWGCNLGFGIRTTDASSATIYIDNIWIYPDGPTAHLFPHAPDFDEVGNVDPDYSDITLKWKAAADPGDPARLPDPNVIYAVHPDIVNEYVFMTTDDIADANLYYVGATGIDPGLDDPNSSYVLATPLPVNSTYRWAIVEGMNGYTQTFTAGVSTLADVDPNNIVGPIWTLQTRTTTPVIGTQPVSTRFGVNDASAQFTIGVDPGYAPSYQWFYSLNNVIDAADTAISASIGGNTNTLTIAAHNKAYQAYFYCRVSNSYTVTGGGSFPDAYSDVVSLVVERKVAEYLFDGNLNDTSTMALHGIGVGSPTFGTGAGGVGQALSLNGSSQYVEVTNGFPRADLFTNVDGGAGTEIGFGGGLDVGSITCWVKLNATAADQVSPILQNANAGWPNTQYALDILTDAAAANTNLRSYIWGQTGEGTLLFWVDVNPVWADPFDMGGDGTWHMLALTWDMNGTVKSYLDGNLLSNWDATESTFSAWDSTVTIGFDGTNYFGGQIDNLRVYNYELTAEALENEAYLVTGKHGCLYDFAGSNHNSNQLGSSYCKIDLADFADLAEVWLNEGFYPPAP